MAGALSLAVACGADGTRAISTQPETSAPTAGELCSDDLTFAPTYLPAGFDAEARPGPGGGADLPDDQTVVHFQGPQGVFIDLFRGGSRYTIADVRPITVLGQEGKLGVIEDGYGVDFTYGTPVVCNSYHIEAFGLGEDDVRRFAEGLEPS